MGLKDIRNEDVTQDSDYKMQEILDYQTNYKFLRNYSVSWILLLFRRITGA
jgi:hypothetical protein